MGIEDPSCGPTAIPLNTRYPGPCSTASDLGSFDFIVSYWYDGAGRLAGWRTNEESEQWLYDSRDRLTSHQYCASDDATCCSGFWKSYDGDRLAEEDDFSCTDDYVVTTYRYDDGGRLAGADINWQPSRIHLLATYRLDEGGMPLHSDVRYEDGGLYATEDWTYDANGRVASDVTRRPAPAYSSTETWRYDDAGRVIGHYDSEAWGGTWETNRYADGHMVGSRSWTAGGGSGRVTSYCSNGLPHAWRDLALGGDGGVIATSGPTTLEYGDQGVWVRMVNADGGTLATRDLDDDGNVLELDGIAAPHAPITTTIPNHTTYDYSCFTSP